MSAEWSKLYDLYEADDQVVIAKYNCEDDISICHQYQITKYPTILHFVPHDTNKHEKFEGFNRFL